MSEGAGIEGAAALVRGEDAAVSAMLDGLASRREHHKRAFDERLGPVAAEEYRAGFLDGYRAAASSRPTPGGDGDELRRAVEIEAKGYRCGVAEVYLPKTHERSHNADRLARIFMAAGLMCREGNTARWLDPAPPEPDGDGLEAAAEAFLAANGEWERDRSEASQARLIAAIERFGAAARARRGEGR